MKTISAIFITVFAFSNCASHQKSDEDLRNKATEEILALHKLQKNYHFEKKAKEFAAQLSENHVSVNRGEIKTPSREELIDRYTNYFNAVEFEKWDDINPPIIKFSNDYTMAYTIVDKEVIVKYDNENGEQQRERTKFSWVAIYRKHENKWQIDCVVSTNNPSEIL